MSEREPQPLSSSQPSTTGVALPIEQQQQLVLNTLLSDAIVGHSSSSTSDQINQTAPSFATSSSDVFSHAPASLTTLQLLDTQAQQQQFLQSSLGEGRTPSAFTFTQSGNGANAPPPPTVISQLMTG